MIFESRDPALAGRVATALEEYRRRLARTDGAEPAGLAEVVAALTRLARRTGEDPVSLLFCAPGSARERLGAPTLADPLTAVDLDAVTPPALLSYAAARSHLGVSARSFTRLVAAGAVPVVEVAGTKRVRRADLDAYVQQMEPTA